MNRALTLLMIACLSLSSIAFGVAADETEDIPANAAATGVHEALVAALGHAGLVETLQGDGPFTVFAPTDDAFAAVPENILEALGNNIDELTDVLLYHV
ncbi:MAG: fasciclin domain-containing protein, partial [Candidatus Thermoplasmatota archaeon]|nr:fasciclin domain-containing protein [Candidatus Thermoplasmatota archaeon]